jgi:endonuclease YncB( thermonuclease family)
MLVLGRCWFWAKLVVASSLLLWAPLAQAAPKNRCGNPPRLEGTYDLRLGKVIEVPDGVTIVVRESPSSPPPRFGPKRPPAKRLVVRLVNLELPGDNPRLKAQARTRLSQVVLDKDVEIWVSPFQNRAGFTNALVYLAPRLGPLNLVLINEGLAYYTTFGRDALDTYNDCRLLWAQNDAQTGRLGLWRDR